ncbi:MAG TPA: class I SAM-dependent methyltransferase [Candidatus Polarisedimenticolaceae bacterium]|nr:class I SAM-dependent methyltransferase [Candidatus Polarisedimenticolaceae bacterium]
MNQRSDSYEGISRHYDAHGWDWWAGTRGGRLIGLLKENGIASSAAILDAGCGTGTLALHLAAAGYRVTGVDLSPAMIEAAKAKDRKNEVTWTTGDLTALDLGATFDGVVSVCDVLNHLDHLDQWEKAFASMRRHLRPGGLAVVDAITCMGLTMLESQSVQERDGKTLILACIWEPSSRRSTLKIVSFAPSGTSGLFERRVATITEWGQSVEEIIERARRGGFASVERVWPTASDPEQEERLTLIARA